MGWWFLNPGQRPIGANLTHSRESTKAAGRRQKIAHGVSRGGRSAPCAMSSPYSASIMASTNWYRLITCVTLLTLMVSSTSGWKPTFSSIVARGNRPP